MTGHKWWYMRNVLPTEMDLRHRKGESRFVALTSKIHHVTCAAIIQLQGRRPYPDSQRSDSISSRDTSIARRSSSSCFRTLYRLLQGCQGDWIGVVLPTADAANAIDISDGHHKRRRHGRRYARSAGIYLELPSRHNDSHTHAVKVCFRC